MGRQDRSSFSDAMRKSGPYLSLGTGLAVPVLLGAWVGHWLDGKWETEPWFLLGGCILGLVVGFVNFLRVVLKKPGGES